MEPSQMVEEQLYRAGIAVASFLLGVGLTGWALL